MALRSPTIVHPYWGNSFVSAAQLPNVSGSSTQSANLEKGDTAYAAGVMYFCTLETPGAATWVAIRPASSTKLWSWNEVDVSQFTLAVDQASQSPVLTVETHATLGTKLLVYSKGVTGSAGYNVWTINDFVMPASGRFILSCNMGPRASGGAVYGANVIPGIVGAFQANQRWAMIIRNSGAVTLMNIHIFNNNATSAFYPNSTGFGLGPNTDYGAFLRWEVLLKQPAAAVDPQMNFAVMTDIDSNLNTATVSADTPAVFGGTAAPAGGWNAAWQAGPDLAPAVLFFGFTGAGKSYLSQLSIHQHPLDYQ